MTRNATPRAPSNHSRKPTSGSSFSKRKANKLGYAQRQQSRPGKSSGHKNDVYEYTQDPRVRRSKVTLDLGKEDLDERHGGDASDDEEDVQGEKGIKSLGGLKVRMLGENGEDERIDSDEDEEIDSDEAFEESDEERFAGFSFASDAKKGKLGHKKKLKTKTKSAGVRFADVDLNEDSGDSAMLKTASKSESDEDEDDDEDEDGDPEDFIDILDILDAKGEAEKEDENVVDSKPAHPKSKSKPAADVIHNDEDALMHSDSDSSSAEEEDDEEDVHHALSASDSDEDQDPSSTSNALDALSSFISTLPSSAPSSSKKRKASKDEQDDGTGDAANGSQSRKRRVLLKERTEAGPEGEFRAAFGAGAGSTSKLALSDLLGPLASSSSSQSALSALKKNTKALSNSAAAVQSTKVGAGPLSAPLPQRTQEKLDREAAYEQTKAEVDKWNPTMKRIKEAEHLSFPLQAESKAKVSNLELAAKFKPTTTLETSVAKLLKAAELHQDASIHESEERALQGQQLSLEEVAARRAELRKMRELMFRAESKAKRVAKIKSKTYRKIQRKAQAKLASALDQNAREDGEEGEEERLKREVERARERATLKHRSTGKWAKMMRGKGEMDGDDRRAMEEMLERGEKLRRRIHGVGSGEDEDGDMDSDGEDEEDETEEKIRTRAFDELDRLNAQGAEEDPGKKGKGLFEMKFMKDAMARQQLKADRMADDFVHEMGGHEDGSIDVDGEGSGQDSHDGVAIFRSGTSGRMTYRPAPPPGGAGLRVGSQQQLNSVISVGSDTSSVTLKSSDLDFIAHPSQVPAPQEIAASAMVVPTIPSAPTSNPWLARASDVLSQGSHQAKKKSEVVVSKDSKQLDKARNKMTKKERKREEDKERRREDAEVEVDLDDVMVMASNSATIQTQSETQVKDKDMKGKDKTKTGSAALASSSTSASKPAAITAPDTHQDDSDSETNSEVEEQERALETSTFKGKLKEGKGVRAFEQRDLVARAFAGDNVVKDFEEAKKREIAEDAPKEVDTTLQGWGSWGGLGAKRIPAKPHLIKKVAGVNPTTRADANKAHVIISEKRDKKAAKYMVKDLPYPYTSRAQYEKSIERPMGTEWNTRVAFQKATLPKVVIKSGTIIDPLTKMF